MLKKSHRTTRLVTPLNTQRTRVDTSRDSGTSDFPSRKPAASWPFEHVRRTLSADVSCPFSRAPITARIKQYSSTLPLFPTLQNILSVSGPPRQWFAFLSEQPCPFLSWLRRSTLTFKMTTQFITLSLLLAVVLALVDDVFSAVRFPFYDTF